MSVRDCEEVLVARHVARQAFDQVEEVDVAVKNSSIRNQTDVRTYLEIRSAL